MGACNCASHTAASTTAATQAATFTVADMSCGHCVSTIRAALEETLPGAAVEIDLASKRVSVSGDAAAAAAAIVAAGYTPVSA